MFGEFLDYLRVWTEVRTRGGLKKVRHIQIKNKNSKEKWICFFPEYLIRWNFLKNSLIPNTNVEVYLTPKTTIKPNPKETKKILATAFSKAVKNQKDIGNEKINVIGISLGNALAYKFANKFKVKKFISVVPGSKLPECIFESISTKKIARNSKKGVKDYQKELNDFSPINNLKIKADKIYIYMGDKDKMIPSKRGEELMKSMKKKGLNPKIKVYRNSGHVESIFNFSREFKRSKFMRTMQQQDF